MKQDWLLIHDSPLPGSVNMARDLQIMEKVAEGSLAPVLRFYSWSPPALSLGRNQRAEEVADLEACSRLGIDVVQRPSGGRAVLHYRELTYSIAVKQDYPGLPWGVLDTYCLFSRGIVEGLRSLNVDAFLAPEENHSAKIDPGACFDTASAFEVYVQGKKVVGSAQLRRGKAVLQHGSILFQLPLDLYSRVLKKQPGAGCQEYLAALEQKAAGLEDLGYRVSEKALAAAVRNGLGGILGARFTANHEGLNWS